MVNPRPYIAKNNGVTMRHREMGVRLLRFIYEYREENGFPPSVREICAELGYNSTSSGKSLLERTEARGWISVNTKTPRGIKILADGMEIIQQEIAECSSKKSAPLRKRKNKETKENAPRLDKSIRKS